MRFHKISIPYHRCILEFQGGREWEGSLDWNGEGMGGGGGAVFSSTFPDGKELVSLHPSVQPAPSWLDSSTGTGVAEVMGTGIAEVMGSNPIQA